MHGGEGDHLKLDVLAVHLNGSRLRTARETRGLLRLHRDSLTYLPTRFLARFQ